MEEEIYLEVNGTEPDAQIDDSQPIEVHCQRQKWTDCLENLLKNKFLAHIWSEWSSKERTETSQTALFDALALTS